jgi:hypothetical protein
MCEVCTASLPDQVPDQNVLPPLNPGDVIAFSGNGLDAKIIQWFTWSPYSHTAIVLGQDQQRPGDILIAESTTYTTLPDFRQQSCQAGMQIHWLSAWLEIYQAAGQAWWFPLKDPLTQDKTSKLQSWLWSLYDSQVPFSCPKSVGAWFARSKYRATEPKSSRTIPQDSSANYASGLFCSELVTEALRVTGVVHSQLNPACHTPKDVAQFDCFHEPRLIESGSL